MEISIVLRDTEDGSIEIEETRLPYFGETSESVTTATILADELRKSIEQHGFVETTACGIPVRGNDEGGWDEV